MFGLFLFWISQFKDVFTKRLFFIRIFRVLNTVQSFIFKVQSVACSHQQLVHYIRAVWFCQALFWKVFSEAFPFRFSCCSTATLIVYHVVFALSTTFLSYLFCCSSLLSQWYILYHACQILSSTLFHFFIFCVRHKQ